MNISSLVYPSCWSLLKTIEKFSDYNCSVNSRPAQHIVLVFYMCSISTGISNFFNVIEKKEAQTQSFRKFITIIDKECNIWLFGLASKSNVWCWCLKNERQTSTNLNRGVATCRAYYWHFFHSLFLSVHLRKIHCQWKRNTGNQKKLS